MPALAGSEYAVAEFRLPPRDYERVEAGARVDLLLPDNSSVAGKVGTVSVTTEGGLALTHVTISSDALRDPARSRLNLPVAETDGVYGQDPQFRDAARGDVRLRPDSPLARFGARPAAAPDR